MLALLFAAALAWTGNESCRPCHRELYDRYMQSPMARSSGRLQPGGVKLGSFGHRASGVHYRIDADGTVRWTAGTVSGERRLEYFIGSGAAGRSFLFSVEGYLFQAPVTWYAQQAKWDVSPGYEQDRSTRWSRPIEPNCLFCHASQARPIYGTQNRYADPPFAQSGVGCERCHGPGSEHIAGRGSMVNPARLPPAERDSVCSQCHLSGSARIEKPGKRIAAFRAGERLDDYVTFFVPASADGGAMRATSHMEKLEASACKQASGDKLWCGTCHSPHRTLAATDGCISCHKPDQCGRGPECAACHMPKSRVVDGGHGVLTDHSIPRRVNASKKAPAEQRLVPFRGYTATNRELGLAYAEAGQPVQARKLLSSVKPDAAVLTHLGQWEAALRADPNSAVAMVNLGVSRASAGDLSGAESLWRRALQSNPGLMAAGTNLVRLLQATGRRREAEELMGQLRKFEPQFNPSGP